MGTHKIMLSRGDRPWARMRAAGLSALALGLAASTALALDPTLPRPGGRPPTVTPQAPVLPPTAPPPPIVTTPTVPSPPATPSTTPAAGNPDAPPAAPATRAAVPEAAALAQAN